MALQRDGGGGEQAANDLEVEELIMACERRGLAVAKVKREMLRHQLCFYFRPKTVKQWWGSKRDVEGESFGGRVKEEKA